MKRREFLKRSAIATAGAAAAASGMNLIAFADTGTAAKLSVLDQQEAATLLAMARQIYPHEQFSEANYQPVVQDLDAEAATKPETAKLLRDGIAKLDQLKGAKFTTLSPDDQVSALKTIQDSPFFQKVRSTEIVSLYNNHEVWKQLGYPGASFPIGGYIHHGFNDLKWLPDPPESASPKAS